MKKDREKWDHRYSQETVQTLTPDSFLYDYQGLLSSGRALDAACGLGANSIFLAAHGYEVDAIDISVVAVSRLRAEATRRNLPIRCLVADLDNYILPKQIYDLVVVFYFFSPPFIAQIRSFLKTGGLLFYSTYNERHRSIKPTFNPAYLIPPDGLAYYFSDFTILVHETSAGEFGNVSRFIGRKT